MKIYLDDQADMYPERMTPEGWLAIKTPDKFKEVIEGALKNGEKIEAIDFDNDLGEPVEGRHLVKWLQDAHPEIIDLNPEIEFKVHSRNNVANETLRKELNYLRKNYKELIEAKERSDPWAEPRAK